MFRRQRRLRVSRGCLLAFYDSSRLGQAKREKIGASICTIPDKASPFRDGGGRDPLARPESATPWRSAPLKKILPASLKFCGLVLQKKKAFSDDSDGGPGSQSKDSGGPTDESYRRPSRNDRSPAPHGSERRMQGLSPGTTLLLVEDKPDASGFVRNPPSHSELIKGASQLVIDRLTINQSPFASD